MRQASWLNVYLDFLKEEGREGCVQGLGGVTANGLELSQGLLGFRGSPWAFDSQSSVHSWAHGLTGGPLP